MWSLKTLTGLRKHFPKKINQESCKIWYTKKMTTFPECNTVDTTNLQPGEPIHMQFAFFNVTSIIGFTSILTVVCANNIILWVFPTVKKISPVQIILFILTTLNNEKHSCKKVRLENYGSFANSTDVTNLPVEEFRISMETTSGDASWLNWKNKIQNWIVHNMVIQVLLDINKHENWWCYESETSAEVYRCKLRIALDTTSHPFSWYGKKHIIHELRTFVCDIYPITFLPKELDESKQEG